MDMGNFIVPPKLSRKQLLFGFTVWECAAIVTLIVLTIFTKQMFLSTVAAFVAVLSFRAPETEGGEYRMNAREYLLLLARYFKSRQVYSLRECESRNENQ